MLRIGSTALKFHNLLSGREPKDRDIIITWDQFNRMHDHAPVRYPLSKNKWVVKYPLTSQELAPSDIWDCEIAWEGSTGAELLERAGDRTLATPEECLALKLSHRYLKDSPHFMKTMLDIQHLRAMGYELDEWLTSWISRREKETYTYNHPSLNRTKKAFFSDDGIDYKFDHDSLHQAMKLNEKPAYQFFKSEDEEVLCDMDKFDSLPNDIKLCAVWEESAVLALERSVIPLEGEPNAAFKLALEKVCTSITSGRFREFAWENYTEVMRMHFSKDIRGMFTRGLLNGTIKLKGKGNYE